jgi:hypothetical protein
VTAAVHLRLIPATAYSQSVSPAAEEVLGAAESAFKFMKAKDYPAIWQVLTVETKNEIVASVRKAAKKAGQEYTAEQLVQDFASGGPQAKAYWDAYLNVFNPDMVLEDCKWSLGPIEKNVAAVIVQYKKSDKPAILILKKEGGAWRLGLDETFGARKWLP